MRKGQAGGQAASCLHAGWLPAPEQPWPSLPCWQGAGRRPGKGAGCLPTRLHGVRMGAGYTCPANNCSSHSPARPGSWTLPSRLSPPTPSIVLQLRIHRRYQDPSKCGPCEGGNGGPTSLRAPWGAAATHCALVPEPSLYAPGFTVVPSCPSPGPTGTDPQLPHWLGASLPALGLFPLQGNA